MATVACLRSAWDALTPDQQAAVRAAVVIEPTGWLAIPARQFDEAGIENAVWDDPLLTDDHAVALAAAVESFA